MEIALYEEPIEKDEKNNNMFDNMAFYDSVAIIAGRSVVTIDPISEKPKEPVTQQPRRVKWWQGDEPDNKDIIEDKAESASLDNLVDIKNKFNLSTNSLDHPEHKREQRSPSISKLGRAQTLAVIDDERRKKGLLERRMSRSQTFSFNGNMELPLIRQLSMPKFYVTDENQPDTALVKPPTSALSPVQPQDRFNFDLRSVVQMEKERDYSRMQESPRTPDVDKSSRLANIRGKLKPLKIKRQTSSVSVIPNTTLHM